MEPQVDNVETVNGLTTEPEQYAVYYPYDGLLVVASDKAEAQDDVLNARTTTSEYFRDAYAVRITIERVVDRRGRVIYTTEED